MNVTLQIEVPDDGRETFVHCFRNFGEDVWSKLRNECSVSLQEVDASTTSFCIRDIKQTEVYRISACILEIANKHFFSETIKIIEHKSELEYFADYQEGSGKF